MSKWARTHALKTVGPGQKKNWGIDPIFKELFHFDQYEDYKHFREFFFSKYQMKISDFTFSEGRRTLEDTCKSVAKKLCFIHEDLGTPILELLDLAKGYTKRYCYDLIGIRDEKEMQYKKSLEFMGTTSQAKMNRIMEIIKMPPKAQVEVA